MPPPDEGAGAPSAEGLPAGSVPRDALLLWTHDIRSPLAALFANLHHVRDVMPGGDADTAEVVGECLALCGVLERYVTNLEVLHQGRVGRGPTRVRLRDVAADVVRRLAPHAVMTEHRLELVARGSDEPIVTADATLLRIALENAVSSAMEQAPPGAVVLEIASRDGDGLVTLIDGGPPWTAAQAGSLELRGVDAQTRLAGERAGRGLGLPSAALAAKAGGAHLGVEEWVGGGGRLTLRAPLAAAPAGVRSP